MLKIAVDIDDTIADFITGLNNYANKVLDACYKIEDYTNTRFGKIWSNVTEERSQEIITQFIFSNNSLDLIPIKDAYDVLKEIKNLGGVEFHIVSARHTLLMDDTKKWLDTHYPDIFSSITLCNYHGEGEKLSKGDVCVGLGVKVLIDDNPLNLDNSNSFKNLIIHKKPWNNEGYEWIQIKAELIKLYNEHINTLTDILKNKDMLIGISGKIGSGKNAAADIITEIFPMFKQFAFANRLKETVAALTATSMEMNNDRKQKGYIAPGFTYSLGRLHQKIGSGMKELIDPLIWVNCLISSVTKHSIITDCRHICEADACAAKDAILIRINGDPLKIRELNKDGRDLNHISETELDNYPFIHVIDNNGTLSDLRRKILDIIVNQINK
jgi:5'(3')-deoxyribonucleotidase